MTIKELALSKATYARKCSYCGGLMNEGYCIESGESYFCSDICLSSEMTKEEFNELYDDGDSYWTEWEDGDHDYNGLGELIK